MSDRSQKIAFTGGMNSDVEPRLLPPGDTLPETYNFNSGDILNGTAGVGANLYSNSIRGIGLPAGTNTTIGSYYHEQTKKLYRFNYNSQGFHNIIETNWTNNVSVFVMIDKTNTGGAVVLNFNIDYLILHVNIKSGKLYFTQQGWMDAMDININKAITGGYGTITTADIRAAKAQPLSPPIMSYTTDTAKTINKLKRKMFNSRYDWVYDDFEESAWSTISKRPFIPSEQNPNIDSNAILNNVLLITVNTGPKGVTKINIAVSDNDTFNFYQVITINKAELGLADNINYTYRFYNDAVGVAISQQDSLLNYDYFPRNPVTQDLIADDIIAYGNYTEGRDNIVTDIRTTLTYATPPIEGNGNILTRRTFKENSAYVPGIIYESATGDQGLVQNKNSNKFDTPGLNTNHGQYGVLNWEIYHQPPVWAVKWQFVLTKNLTHQNYFQWITDDKVKSNDTAVIGRQSEQFINLSLNGLITQLSNTENNYSFGYDFEAGDRVSFISSVNIDNGNETAIPFYDTEILARIQDDRRQFNAAISNKTGDKKLFVLRDQAFFTPDFIGRQLTINGTTRTIVGLETRHAPNDSIVVNDDIDETENNTDWSVTWGGTWIRILKPPFDITANTFVEVYKPKISIAESGVDDVYYEVGEAYDVLSPGQPTRAHQGQINDQSGATPARGIIYGADSYLKTRIMGIPLTAVQVLQPANPNNPTRQVKMIVEDFNFSDWYPSKLYDYGRFSAVNPNAKEVKEIATYRWSRPYIQDTSINGLSRFYPGNKKSYESQYGELLRIKYRNKVLEHYQELKGGKILLNQRILADNTGDLNVAVSDQLFNDIQYYPQDFGIGRMPEAVAFYDAFTWFADSNKNVVCEVNGLRVQDIGLAAFMSKFWTNKLSSLSKAGFKLFGYIDPERKLYLLTNNSGSADTVAYDMIKKRFTHRPTFKPEFAGIFGDQLCTFNAGALWVHDITNFRNTYYGQANDPSIVTFVFNDLSTANKILLAMKYQANRTMGVPSLTIPLDEFNPQGMLSKITANNFEYLEGDWYSTFLKDMLTPGAVSQIQALYEGRELRGKYAIIQMRYDGDKPLSVAMVEVYYTASMPTD